MKRAKKLLEGVSFFQAMKATQKAGYGFTQLKKDLMAGFIVALVGIPLGMAFAIAIGVPPQYGLYTVVFSGMIALLGGSRFQVSGPTATFVVILVPVVHKFGLAGLLTTGVMAGFIMFLMGFARFGKLMQFIPYPVTTGLTTGIAFIIALLQIKDFFGLQIYEMPEKLIDKIIVLFSSMPSLSLTDFSLGVFTLVILIYWSKINKKIPAPMVALGASGVIVYLLNYFYPAISVSTIQSQFGGLPNVLPKFTLPWDMNYTPGVSFHLNLKNLEVLFPSAFSVAILGAVETLLSAVVADGLTQTNHDPDSELMSLGIGNMICPFFGGIAASGAIARTATNIKYGAYSPLSAVFHSVFTLMAILFASTMMSYLPLAALAALLLVVAYNMADLKHFFHIIKVAPREDITVLLVCFSLTILFDMIVGVTVGVVFASFLFIRRMSDASFHHEFKPEKILLDAHFKIPSDMILYEIEGPLFFGAAQKAAEALVAIGSDKKIILLSLEHVPVMDITGLVAFESALRKLIHSGKKVILIGLKKELIDLLERDQFFAQFPEIQFCATFSDALLERKSAAETLKNEIQ